MRRVAAAVLLLVAGLGVAAQTAPFWESLPYMEWTMEQTLKVLTNSPWARPATLVEPGVQIQTGRLQHYAQWYSALTVREGLVRLRQLRGHMNPQGDAQFLGSRSGGYQLYVFVGVLTGEGELRVLPLAAFEGLTEEEIRQGARLIFSSQEFGSRPDKVEFVHDPKTQQVIGLRLIFARARAGLPPEEARRGQVRLVLPTARGSLSATFLLGEMQRRGQPDL